MKRSLAFRLGVAGAAAFSAYLLAIRPWHLRWGTTRREAQHPLPGDELIPSPGLASTRAITIQAPTGRVWPWLVQIGQGRGGFYSYDWLENLAGLDIHTVDHIRPELQDLKVGDLVPFFRGGEVRVFAVEPNKLLVLAGTLFGEASPASGPGQDQVGGSWVFQLDRLREGACRLIVRSRVAGFQPRGLSWLLLRLLEPAHFVMERKMLLGIKARAERN